MARRSLFSVGRTEDGRDAALVDDAAAGNEDAFAELFRRHGADVIRMVQRRSGSSAVADDVTAIAFERAWRSLAELSDRKIGFRPWVFRVAINELIDHQRSIARRSARERRVLEHESAVAPAADATLTAHLGDIDVGGVSGDDLRAAMLTLSTAQQEIITLRFFADMEPAEIAATLGIARGAVGVRTHRAIETLRVELGTHSEDGTTP